MKSFLERGRVLQEPGVKIDRVYFPQRRPHLAGDQRTRGSCNRHRHDRLRRRARPDGRARIADLARPARWSSSGGRAQHIAPARFAAAAAESASLREMIVRYNDALLAQVQQVARVQHGAPAGGALVPLAAAGVATASATRSASRRSTWRASLGVQRTTVTMICRRLQSDGVLNVRRGRIMIRDATALERKSCDCVRITRGLLEQHRCATSH